MGASCRRDSLGATRIHDAIPVALLTECSTSAGCASCTSCTRAARSPPSPTRSSSRPPPSPSSSPCSSARPGVPLLEPAGRGRPADRRCARARRPRRRAARARRARRGRPGRRHRRASPAAGGSRPSSRSALRVAVPAIRALAREAPEPALRADRVRARGVAARARARRRRPRAGRRVGAPAARPAGRHRPRGPPQRPGPPRAARGPPGGARHRDAVPLAELAGEAWTTGHPGTAWEDITERTCRGLGGFDPDIRHRTNDSVLSLALVADGQAVTLLPRARPARRATRRRRQRRSPRARCTARSSPPPAPPTRGGPPSRRCSRPSAPPPGRRNFPARADMVRVRPTLEPTRDERFEELFREHYPALRTARDTFDPLDCVSWSKRARRELRARGGRAGDATRRPATS